ncbi:hypothetical protein PTKIN_Ptkin09bG0285500 [Pterospermum kingtungense]
MGILSDVNLLLRGYQGKPAFGGTFYISALSNPNFSQKHNLVLPDAVSKFFSFFVSSCNGLLFLDDFTGNSLIWNPSSGEHKFLPPTCLGKDDSHPAVDRRSFFCSGFGYDPKSEDYKVVRFLKIFFEEDEELEFKDDEELEFEDDQELPTDEYRVELYSVNSNSWKPISYTLQAHPFYDQSTYIDGVYFWVAFDRSGVFIVSYNFADEEFSTFPIPECNIWKDDGVQLIEFDRSLAIVIYPPPSYTERHFDIWVWNGKSWTKKFTTEPLPDVLRLLGFSKNGKHMFLEGSNYQLLLYDLETKELKDAGIRDDFRGTLQLIHYVEGSAQLSGKSLAKK